MNASKCMGSVVVMICLGDKKACLLKWLRDLSSKIRLAMLKLEIGDKYATDSQLRKRFFERVTILSSLAGYAPITPDIMSRIYLQGFVSDIEKLRKRINSLIKICRKQDIYLCIEGLNAALNRVEEILNIIQSGRVIENTQRIKRLLIESMSSINEVYSYVKSLIGYE